jgi:hypothetical protein
MAAQPSFALAGMPVTGHAHAGGVVNGTGHRGARTRKADFTKATRPELIGMAALPKGNERNAVIASEISQRMAVPNAWIAEALQLGCASRVSHCVRMKCGSKLNVKLTACLAR